ncbi:MAG: SCP-like extracellular [Solirubrobacterales bacterium]|nr:SCP-like extracellular [Solirubrobacterales bacterium]
MPIAACDSTHNGNVTFNRLALVAAACALLLGACGPISEAFGHTVARSKAHPTAKHRRTASRRSALCARNSSFHARSRHGRTRRHTRRTAACPKRRSRTHHAVHKVRRRLRRSRSRHPAHHPAKRHAAAHHSPAPTATGACAYAELQPNGSDLGRIRSAILCLVNRERMTRGERALRANGRLEKAAQGHSEEMSHGGPVGHISRRGGTPLSRVRADGYIYNGRVGYELGENIAWGTLWMATPRAIVAAWMVSPGHRENILDARYRDTAVGVSARAPASLGHGQPGAVYTQEFGTIIPG